MRRRAILGAAAASFLISAVAHALPAADRTATLLVYPILQVGSDRDTVIHLSNESESPITLRCFYAGGQGRCANNSPCSSPFDCTSGVASCVPVPVNTPFQVRLTPRQPLSWRASQGRASFPCAPESGCPDGATNDGSSIPALGASYLGALECVVVDGETGKPTGENVLRGSADLEQVRAGDDYIDVARYGAIGFQGLPGAVNDNSVLTIGTSAAELEACPNRLSFVHPSELQIDTAGADAQVAVLLALMPCTWDFAHGLPPRVSAQIATFNEFEQRFNTSIALSEPRLQRLTSITGGPPTSSIFAAPVIGTASLHTDIAPSAANSGVLALMIEVQTPLDTPGKPRSEALQAFHQGLRSSLDVVFLDPPECPGDCLGDGILDETDMTRLLGRFNRGCACQNSGADDNGCTIGAQIFFPFNQCYAADHDGDRCLEASELTRVISQAAAHSATCP